MLIQEYVAHKLIGTPLEGTAKGLRELTKLPQRIRHPELREIYAESERAKLAMSRLITNSMNCIDVGAHLGSVLNLIKQLSPQGTHRAIEPIPYKCKWLEQKFPDVEVLSLALSDAEGEADFYVLPSRSGFSGLALRGFHKRNNQEIEVIKVKLARLDEIVPQNVEIGFIKIDVEGAELSVLKGSERILNCYSPAILFECFPKSFEAHDFTALQIYNFFLKYNYAIFLIKDWLSNGEPLSYEQFMQAMQYPFQAFNFLAISQS